MTFAKLRISLSLVILSLLGGFAFAVATPPLSSTVSAVTQTAPGEIQLDPAIEPGKNDCKVKTASALNASNCGIIAYVVQITNVMSAVVGIIVVGSIIWGGILYSSAGSDPQAVASARKRIRNAIIALVIYLFSFAFIQWLVPGGLL